MVMIVVKRSNVNNGGDDEWKEICEGISVFIVFGCFPVVSFYQTGYTRILCLFGEEGKI